MAHRDNAHFVTIFFAKERLRAKLTCLIRRHHPRHNGRILTDISVYICLNLLDLAQFQSL